MRDLGVGAAIGFAEILRVRIPISRWQWQCNIETRGLKIRKSAEQIPV